MSGFSIDAFRRTVDDDQVVVIAVGDDPAALRERLEAKELWLSSTPPHDAELDVLFGRPVGLPELLFCRHGVIVRWWLGHSGRLTALDVRPDLEEPFTAERYASVVEQVRKLTDIEAAWREVTAWREIPEQVPASYTQAGDASETLRLELGGSASQRRGTGELVGTWRLRSDGDLDLTWKRFVRAGGDEDGTSSSSELDRREVWQVGRLNDGRVQVRPARGLLPRLTQSHRVFIADPS